MTRQSNMRLRGNIVNRLQVAEGCVRSLMFDNAHEDWPYSTGGTCFLVNHGGRRYLVTAHHCIESRTGEEVQVHADEGYQDGSLPLERRVDISEDQDLAPMATDMVLLRLSESVASDEQRAAFDHLQLDDWYPKRSAPGASLLVVGYPRERKAVDYERRSFRHQKVIADAKYLQDEGNRLHRLELDVPQLKSPQGLSGSPVFAVEWVGGQLVPKWLAGMLIEATDTRPWTMRFVCASVLFGALAADARESDSRVSRLLA